VFLKTKSFLVYDASEQFPYNTADKTILLYTAKQLFFRAYRKEEWYRQTGVVFGALRPKGTLNNSLFEDNNGEKQTRCYEAVEMLNRKRGKMIICSAGSVLHSSSTDGAHIQKYL
jgi:hypothetical protein